MGGHGAINLFLNHPGFFKSAGSTSGILDLLPFPDNWGIKNVLGDQAKLPQIIGLSILQFIILKRSRI